MKVTKAGVKTQVEHKQDVSVHESRTAVEVKSEQHAEQEWEGE